MSNHDRIVRDLEICGGQPKIRGTNVLVLDILDWLNEGKSFDEILENFPAIIREDIQAIITYAKDLIAGESMTHDINVARAKRDLSLVPRKPTRLVMSLVAARIGKLLQKDPGTSVDALIEQVTSSKESFKELDWASVHDELRVLIEPFLRPNKKPRMRIH